MNNLINLIKQKIEELDIDYTQNDKKIDALSKININTKDMTKTINDINNSDFLLAQIIHMDNNADLDTITKDIYNIKDYINDISLDDIMLLEILLNNICIFKDSNIIEFLYQNKNKNLLEGFNNKLKVPHEFKKDYSVFNLLKKKIFNNNIDAINSFVKIVYLYDIKIFEVLFELVDYKLLIEDNTKKKLIENVKIKTKDFEKCIKKIMKNSNFSICEKFVEIDRYKNNLINEKNNNNRERNNQIKKYNELISRIIDHQLDDKTYKLINDENILKEYLIYILKENSTIYNTREKENKDFRNNPLIKFKKLFYDYGYNFDLFSQNDKQLIVEKDLYEIELKMIELEKAKKIDKRIINDNFINILVNYTPDMIKNINNLITIKFIDNNYLINNKTIFSNINVYINLIKIYSLLSVLNIDFTRLSEVNPSITSLNIKELDRTTKLLQLYNYNVGENYNGNYNLLKDISLFDVIDSFIELGLEENVMNNGKYIRNDSNTIIKRILICKELDIPYQNSSNKLLNNINTGKNFYVENNKLDNYIIQNYVDSSNEKIINILDNNERNEISNSILNNEIIQKLDNDYMINNNTYKFGNILISRNKVLRNLTCICTLSNDFEFNEMLFNSIIYKYPKHLDNNNLNQIRNIINSNIKHTLKKTM